MIISILILDVQITAEMIQNDYEKRRLEDEKRGRDNTDLIFANTLKPSEKGIGAKVASTTPTLKLPGILETRT